MANKHILRIHETESDLLSELKDKQIAWATDINEAIWRNGNNFYYIEASKYWNGSEFIEINSDQIYNVYNWDDYLTALSDVGNIKYIYMRENIQAPSVLTQNIDVYGQCEIIVYTGSQIFSFDPSGASNCELRYRGASGSPNFTSLNFLGNSITYVGFETLFVEDVYCRNEDIISSLPIDVQITSGAELGTPKFQYESQDGNFTCSVGTSDFIRELWTVPIFEIQTIGSAEGYKPKGTDFLNNGSSVYSNMSQEDISENFVGDVYTDSFLGLTFTTSQLSGLLRKRFIGGSVLWSFNNLDVWNPSTFSDNPISFIGRGIDFTGGVSIDEDKLCSLTLAPSTSNATLKIGDITDTQNDIYVEVLNIDGDVTLDSASTHNIYYEKINLNGFTLTDSGNVAVQQFWNNTNDSSGGGSPGGSNTQVQFNDGGSFGGDTGLTFDKANGDLEVGGDVDVSGSLKAVEGVISYSDSDSTLTGLVSIKSTDSDPLGKKIVALKQQGTRALLLSGSAATTGVNPLEIWTSDAAGVEAAVARFEDTLITILEDFQVDGDSNVDGTSYTNGGVVSYAVDSSTLTGLVSTYKNTNDPLGDRFVALKQQDTKALLISGNAGGSTENPLRIMTSDPNGDEFIIQQVFYNRVEFSEKLNLLTSTNASPTAGDIWFDGTEVNIEGTVDIGSSGNVNQLKVGEGVTNGSAQNVTRFYYDATQKGYINARGAGNDNLELIATDSDLVLGSSTGVVNVNTNATINGNVICNIPTGTQVGLVGYDANGKLIQGTVGGGGVTPGSWTNVTLASNIGVRSGYRPLRYRSDGIDGVQVEGTCKYNTGFNLAPGFTVVLFTFASGSRPNNDFNVKAQVGYNGSTTEIDAWAHIDASTGQVTLKNSDAIAISELYDISFNFRFSLT